MVGLGEWSVTILDLHPSLLYFALHFVQLLLPIAKVSVSESSRMPSKWILTFGLLLLFTEAFQQQQQQGMTKRRSPDVVVVHKVLPPGTATPFQAYQRCVEIWRDENLGLSLLPPPLLLHRGDPCTGVGLEVMRIPPFGLREGITRTSISKSEDINEKMDSCWMEYKVLNPSWLTWPVQWHRGTISFHRRADSTEILWKVEWVPLLPMVVGSLVLWLTRGIVSHAVGFLAATAHKTPKRNL